MVAVHREDTLFLKSHYVIRDRQIVFRSSFPCTTNVLSVDAQL